MPSPLRKKEVATIAYTRWEAVDAEEEEQLEESAQIHVRWTNSGQFFKKNWLDGKRGKSKQTRYRLFALGGI
jgi:hypothetical protein